MTMRLCFGIDPGATGAIAALADGDAVAVIDMPMYTVKDQSEVDALAIARFMREQMSAHSGAYVSACIERVRAMPAGAERGRLAAEAGRADHVRVRR